MQRAHSSMDRIKACGAFDRGSNPLGRTIKISAVYGHCKPYFNWKDYFCWQRKKTSILGDVFFIFTGFISAASLCLLRVYK